MSVPNQKIITINPDGDFNKERLYAKIHLDTFQQAMKNLKSSDFKLWCYLVKNNPGYTFELSCVMLIVIYMTSSRNHKKIKRRPLKKKRLRKKKLI